MHQGERPLVGSKDILIDNDQLNSKGIGQQFEVQQQLDQAAKRQTRISHGMDGQNRNQNLLLGTREHNIEK